MGGTQAGESANGSLPAPSDGEEDQFEGDSEADAADADGDAAVDEVSELRESAASGEERPEADLRTARPEPLEHAFGAQAHPAEAAASAPSYVAPAPSDPNAEASSNRSEAGPDAGVSTPSDPAAKPPATPEQ